MLYEVITLQQAAVELGAGRARELVILRTNGTPLGILNSDGIVAAVSRGLVPTTPVSSLRFAPFGQVTGDT